MRKSIILSALLLTQIIYSQQDPGTQNANSMSNTASPNAAGFMRFQESPVNYYNGKSSFSIPIYEINVGGIKYPISLYYSQGGIQVNSMASDIGLGWSLTSCFINRTIVGDADLETIDNSSGNGNIIRRKKGFFDFKAVGYIPNGNGETLNVDFYPDMFKFVSPINSSRFYFSNKTQVVELDNKGTRINWTIEDKSNLHYLKDNSDNWINNSLTISDYKDFNLTTNDGISYTFEDKDVTHSFVKNAENAEYSFGNIEGTYPRVSSWYVSKIKNLNNKEEINFTYESYSPRGNNMKVDDIVSNHPYYRYESKYPWARMAGYDNNINFRVDQSSTETDYGKYYNRLLNLQRLTKIKFRGGSVEFSYSKVNRDDLDNGKALTGIIVKDEFGNTVKEFELKYEYFVSTLVKNEFSKRLKLLSIQEKGYNKYEFQYYEDNKLPNIGSPLQDFFGYNNATETMVETPEHTYPKYYYYPNQNEYSILPYDISGKVHYSLENIQSGFPRVNKEPNELSKTWSLKSVTLPTGGKKNYVLESNVFNLWGNNLKGGGTRLQQQSIKESIVGQERIINYYYRKDANTTSGYLFNVPQVGYPSSRIPQDPSILSSPLIEYFLLYSNPKLNYDLLNNFFIGYSKVEENEDGLKTVYEFTNEEKPNILTRSITKYENYLTQYPIHPMGQFLISNSSYGNNFYIDNSYRRGKLKYVSYYDKNGSLKMTKENKYQGYFEQSGEDMDYGYSLVGSSIYSDPDNIGSFWELMQFQKSYYHTNYNLSYTKTTQYLPSGSIEDISNFYYDIRNQNLSEVSHKTGNGLAYPIIDMKRYLYPNMFISEPTMNYLANVINKDDTPVMVINASGEISPSDFWTIVPPQMTSQSKIEFAKDANTSDIALPSQALTAIGQNPFHEVGKFDRYDDKGNLLQSTNDELSTTYIYGYKQLYPIAKIVGAKYDEVMLALGVASPTNSSYKNLDIVKKSDLDKDQISENDLITALDAFRKTAGLSNFSITTYTHNPLIGVSSVTPPSGMREVYTYEAVINKLKEVKRMEKDASGNTVYRTLKEYEYHYKN